MDLSYLKGKGAVAPNTTTQENLPDGTYNVFVWEMKNIKTKAEKDALQVTFKVLDEAHKGRQIWYYLNLPEPAVATEQIIENIQKFIFWFNPDCKDAEQFFDQLTYNQYLDKKFVVKLVTKNYNGKNYQNIYIQKALDTVEKKAEPKKTVFDPFAE